MWAISAMSEPMIFMITAQVTWNVFMSIWNSRRFFPSKFKYWGMLGYTVRQIPKKIVNRCLSFPKKVIHRWRYILLHTMYKHFYINIRQSIYTPNFIESHTQAQYSNIAFDFHNIYSSLFNNIDEKRGLFQTVLSQKSEHTQPLSWFFYSFSSCNNLSLPLRLIRCIELYTDIIHRL